MRIIGGKDYYDAGAAWGQDESVVFVRNGKRALSDIQMHCEIGLTVYFCSGGLVPPSGETNAARKRAEQRYWGLRDIEIDGVLYRQRTGQVLLAGTLYRGLELVRGDARQGQWFWTLDAMDAFAQGHGFSLHEGDSRSGSMEFAHPVTRNRMPARTERVPLSRWFEPLPLDGRVRDAVVLAGITIASNDPSVPPPFIDDDQRPWAVDQPTLAAMDFARALDPYSAHQEIAMWVGGVLPAPAPKMVEITDDKAKIAKAGFHHPTSFRRGKGE